MKTVVCKPRILGLLSQYNSEQLSLKNLSLWLITVLAGLCVDKDTPGGRYKLSARIWNLALLFDRPTPIFRPQVERIPLITTYCKLRSSITNQCF